MRFDEKTKQNIGALIITCILIAYGFIIGYIARWNHEMNEEAEKIKKTNEMLSKMRIKSYENDIKTIEKENENLKRKIRKDGFFLDQDDFD